MQENEIIATPYFGKILWRAEGAIKTKYPGLKDIGNGSFQERTWVSLTTRVAWSRTFCGAVARCKKRLCKVRREEVKRSEREQAREEERRRANFSYEKDCCG